jgi:outer membrane cobalamin receptor
MSARSRATPCRPASCRCPTDLTPPVDPIYTVTIGATSLKPYTSDSFDMSLEWYNRPGGLVSLAVYQKKIDGYIGPITDPSVLCPANGRSPASTSIWAR